MTRDAGDAFEQMLDDGLDAARALVWWGLGSIGLAALAWWAFA